MTDKIKGSIFKPEDRELFSALDGSKQQSILEELTKAEKLLGRKIYISSMEKCANGINVTYSFGNHFLN